MRKRVVTAGLGLMALIGSVAAGAPEAPVGGASSKPAPMPPGVVASVGPVNVPMEQLQQSLIEGYGLNVLLNLVQLDVAKAEALKAGVKVTPADIQQERDQTIDRMFKDSNDKQIDKINAAKEKGDLATANALTEQMKKDNERALDQVLENQHLSRAEFNIVTETNAYLRKMAEPMLKGKISEENLKEAFNTLYGATIQCRHIQCANLQEIAEAKRRLDAGEPFEKVAEEMSRNSGTRPLGGELPPFNLQTQGLPEAFKQAAWALKKEGDVSDPVLAEGGYHLIKLIKKIPPKAVKFEDVKESLRKDLMERAVQAAVKQLRQQVAEQAVRELHISNPVLEKQWKAKLDKHNAAIKDQAAMRKQMDLERERSATQAADDMGLKGPTTLPATLPTTLPATLPTVAPEAE